MGCDFRPHSRSRPRLDLISVARKHLGHFTERARIQKFLAELGLIVFN